MSLQKGGKTRAKNQKMVLVENHNDPACPVSVLTQLRMVCPPQQERMFCSRATIDQVVQYITAKQPYMSNPDSPVGLNRTTMWVRLLTCLVGCPGWELMKNHSVRGGMATILNINDVSILYVFNLF